ncbi:Ig-like V-type domain-containing protein FAM187A, partial [Saccoglossus kowalevskii]|uniref:Ig-like V-type domain-containing protein FAM187A-like n=1 Tax=Saccoglossus kowalevskii TaxID=10224 RepID=A0ABM0MER1_SACKO
TGTSNHVHWFKETKDEVGVREEQIAFDVHDDDEDNRVILMETMSIQVRKTTLGDSGIYRCKSIENGRIHGMYDVEIKEEEPDQINEVFIAEGALPYEPELREGTVLYTKWSEWSPCSRCGEKGETVRMGYCFVEVFLLEYADGVPCKSDKLSRDQLTLFSSRKDERMVDECHELCENQLDITTIAMETLMTRTVRRNVGDRVKLECPGANVDTAITWMNGTIQLRAFDLHRIGGRVRIDVLNILHIRDLVTYDSETYTCYHDREKAAEFKLVVTTPFLKKGSWQYFAYLFAYFIVLTTIFIVVMVVRHHRMMRTRFK